MIIKHVGRHNNSKVVLLYKTVPGEDHMCLIVYSDNLPKLIHDEVMQVLESPVGQNEEEFSSALFRHTMSDGRNALTVLHTEGYIKKVPTNQVIVTPNAKSSIRLDELNTILADMKKGEDAVAKMKSIDDNLGLRDVTKKNTPTEVMEDKSALSDQDIANGLLEQAKSMQAQVELLQSEIVRLTTEAQTLLGKTNIVEDKTTKTNARKKQKVQEVSA